MVSIVLLVTGVLFSGNVFAQETGAEGNSQQPQAAQSQGVGAKMPIGMGPLGRGTLTIDGMFLAGARAKMQNQEDWDKDGNWALEGMNATWGENRADLYMNYALSNYGAFLGLRAQTWDPNTFDYSTIIMPRYAFLYANFGPVKASVGKLYDELLPVPGSRLWKSTGPGDSHRFTDDEAYSIRLEVKPVEGLNIGLQWFFPAIDGYIEGFRVDGRNSVSGWYAKGLDETDAWKELGIGAQYSNDLFEAQLGVRFDSNVDRYNKLDTGPQGKGTYLDKYYGQASLLAKQMPAITFYAPNLGDGARLPRYKHLDKIVEADFSNPPNATAEFLPYDGGHYAFFGFNFKGVKNLTARAHGGLYNLGAFDEFGYGRFSEDFKYQISKLGIGITMQQEFYGGDVFVDELVNSPFVQFGPSISYALVTIPQMPMPLVQVGIETSFGICKDVVDIYAKVKPVINVSLGALMIDMYYEMIYTGYQGSTNIKPTTEHTIGLGAMMLF
jgi:hypothetical protein